MKTTLDVTITVSQQGSFTSGIIGRSREDRQCALELGLDCILRKSQSICCTGNFYLSVQLVSGNKQLESQSSFIRQRMWSLAICVWPCQPIQEEGKTSVFCFVTGKQGTSCESYGRKFRERVESKSYLSHMVKGGWFFAVSYFPEPKMVVAEGVGKPKVGAIS